MAVATPQKRARLSPSKGPEDDSADDRHRDAYPRPHGFPFRPGFQLRALTDLSSLPTLSPNAQTSRPLLFDYVRLVKHDPRHGPSTSLWLKGDPRVARDGLGPQEP